MLKEKMTAAIAHARDAHGVKTNKDFAHAVGIAADRLGNIVSGKVKKLQRDEAVAIEQAYGIRSAWWYSDLAPMLLTEEEKALQGPLGDMAGASAEVLALGLSGWQASFVQELLFNVRRKDAASLQRQLAVVAPGTGAAAGAADHVLLDQWSRCAPSDQAMVLGFVKRLAVDGPTLTREGKYMAQDAPARQLHDATPRRARSTQK